LPIAERNFFSKGHVIYQEAQPDILQQKYSMKSIALIVTKIGKISELTGSTATTGSENFKASFLAPQSVILRMLKCRAVFGE
jgi:hypothetical protein